MDMAKPHIAFLGLGIMGSGMARRLLTNGYPVTVFNRDPDKAKPLVPDGAQVASSPAVAAEAATVIISMVADDVASRSVWLGQQGALSATRRQTVCIECGTVTVGWIRELAVAATQRGCQLLDAPVTGTKPHAAAGELTFLVGGDAGTLEQVRPVLAAMSRAIIYVGPTGSGALLKLINNFLCGVQVASLAEAMGMIERSGLDRTKALDMLMGGAAGSPLLKTIANRMTTPDFTPNFLLRLMAKDLGYAIEEGTRLSVALTTARAALEDFHAAIARGHGDQDLAAVVEPFRTMQAG